MKQKKYGPYLAAGVTAFAVIAAAILLFFTLEHFSAIRALLDAVAYILRPICYGMVLAFLLLPVHRRIFRFLCGLGRGELEKRHKKLLNSLSILLSLLLAFLVVYVLLAMVLPQLYWSIVGLFEAMPGYFQSFQQWLTTFLADNPDIQQAVLSYYRTAGAALNQWLSSDLIPNLESASSTLAWLRSELLPQLTGVVSGVSTVVLALVNLLKDIIVAVIVSVYLLARKDVFAAQSKKILYSMFPTRVADLLVEESRSAYRILSGFINGTLVDSFIVGVICLICFTVFQFPYPMLLAVIIGVTNVIPFFWTLHRGHSQRTADSAGQPPAVPLFCDFHFCAAAAGRQHPSPEDSGQLGGAGLLLGAVCGAAVRRTVRLCGHGAGRARVRHVLQRGQPPGEPRPEKAGPAPEDRGVPGKDRPAGGGKGALPAGAGRYK